MPTRDHGTEAGQSQRDRTSRRGVGPLLLATGVSVSGDGALNTAAPLLAASLTANPLAVASVTAAAFVPWLLVGLPAGALVDRWSKRRVMVVVNIVQAAILGVFCVLLATGQIILVALVVTVLLVNIAHCFFSPASQSAIPAIVGRDQEALRRINGRYLSVDGVGRALIGPVCGAWIFTVARILPFLADAVSFALSAALLRRLPRIEPSPGPREPVFSAMLTGFRQLYRIRQLFVLTLGSFAYNIGYFAAIAPFALYTRDVLHVNAIWFGGLFAVLATAGIVTGWVGTGLIRGVPDLQVRAITLAVPGLAWLLAALIPNIWVTVALFACIGATAVLGSTTINAASQRLAPKGSIGRISSIVRLFAYGASGIGALLGGWAAAGWGLVAPLIVAAAVQVAAGIAIWIWQIRLDR